MQSKNLKKRLGRLEKGYLGGGFEFENTLGGEYKN